MNPMRRLATALVLLTFSSPVWGYVVLLKDGTQLITREKYRRDGDRVVLVLPSGTETFIDASEVDFEKTEELNTINIGQARLIEQQADTVIVEDEEPHQPESLRELAGKMSLSLPEVGQREVRVEVPLTPAGFVDLDGWDKELNPDLELTGELARFLKSQNADGYKIYKGTEEGRVLLEMTTNTEAAVFQGLHDAAAALIQVQSLYPDKLEAMELLLTTKDKVRAGQFVLTRDMAGELVSEQVDPKVFFSRYVQF